MTPTPAQRVALEEIRDGKVVRYLPVRLGYRKTADPRWQHVRWGTLKSRSDTIDRCYKAGWARLEPGSPARMHVPLEITDAGREALQ